MKRFLSLALVLVMMLTLAACGDNTNETTTANNNETTTAETTTAAPVTTPAVNEGEFKAGVYTATSSYATEGMNMTWNFVLTLKQDGTFTLVNDLGEAKGEGTYALTDTCYTLTYSDDRTGTFAVQEDGTLKMTSDFPFGMATIQLALVGDIVFTYQSAAPGEEDKPGVGGGENEGDDTAYTLAAGTYTAVYEKVSAMAGTVAYHYTAVIGTDGTFAYSVKFAMGGVEMDGSAANGTYQIVDNQLIFTDSEGNAVVGKLTADNTLTISLKASQMAQDPYEVTFTPEAYTFAAGTYTAVYEKVSAMAGTVAYNYTAVIGADGTFSYFVKFAMGGTEMDGSAATGTYTIEGNTFTFTDSENNVIAGTLTGDNALTISLNASQMAKEPYEVTFTPAEYTLAAGTYTAVYEKVSAMAGTVAYNYTATISADGTFAYSVKFAMGGVEMDGSAANGTYTLEGNTFTFTDSENNVIVGTLTGNNALTISLNASQMAKEPYEVTFTAAAANE